jgi:hypothetical protein
VKIAEPTSGSLIGSDTVLSDKGSCRSLGVLVENVVSQIQTYWKLITYTRTDTERERNSAMAGLCTSRYSFN